MPLGAGEQVGPEALGLHLQPGPQLPSSAILMLWQVPESVPSSSLLETLVWLLVSDFLSGGRGKQLKTKTNQTKSELAKPGKCEQRQQS